MRGDALAKVSAWSDRARVVHAGGDVVLAVIGGASLGDELLQAVAVRGAICAILDHTGDLAHGARVLDVAGVVAGAGAVVALHEAWVPDAVVGGRGAHAAIALLHDDGKDEAGIDARRGTNILDGIPEILVLGVLVVGGARELRAGVGEDVEVGIEPAREGSAGNPTATGGELGRSRATHISSKVAIHWSMDGHPWEMRPSPEKTCT